MAHLSCVGSTREELREILDGMRRGGDRERARAARRPAARRDRVAARIPAACTTRPSWPTLIRERYPFSVGAACFPEVHPEAPDLAHDLRFLKDEGRRAARSFLITQLFFDNELYFRFVEEARAAGIEVPIIPGIMPITDVEPDQDDHRHVRGDDPAGAARGARVARRRSRRGAPARRRLRHAPVRRAAGPRRAGHPLLHAEPLAGHARDPVGAAAAAPVGAARGRPHRGPAGIGHHRSAWATVGRPSTS